MRPNEEELELALRGGLRGRFRNSFHLLQNAFEVLDDRMQRVVTPAEYGELKELLRQIDGQLALLRRLGEHAADAADASLLHRVCEPRPMELLGQLREITAVCRESLAQEGLDATLELCAAPELQMLATTGDAALLDGILAGLLSNSLTAARPVHVTLACAPGLLRYTDDGPGLPPDALALLNEGRWSDRLLAQGGLGLPLIRVYAEAMGWKLTARPGPGTALDFALPPCTIQPEDWVLGSPAASAGTADRRLRVRQELRAVALRAEA